MAGMFEEAYKQKIDELVNDGIIEYLGYQANMKSLYGAASCVVLPSYHEGMSNVLLEAAATGRPLMGRRGREQMEKRFNKDAVVAETMKWLGIING